MDLTLDHSAAVPARFLQLLQFQNLMDYLSLVDAAGLASSGVAALAQTPP